MGDLTTHFSRHEFACLGKNCCGGAAPVSYVLVEALQRLRYDIALSVNINSAFRCLTHNRRTKRSKDTSQHVLGTAADIWVRGMTPDELFNEVRKVYAFFNGGIGVYETFVHVDVRPNGPVRWRGIG